MDSPLVGAVVRHTEKRKEKMEQGITGVPSRWLFSPALLHALVVAAFGLLLLLQLAPVAWSCLWSPLVSLQKEKKIKGEEEGDDRRGNTIIRN